VAPRSSNSPGCRQPLRAPILVRLDAGESESPTAEAACNDIGCSRRAVRRSKECPKLLAIAKTWKSRANGQMSREPSSTSRIGPHRLGRPGPGDCNDVDIVIANTSAVPFTVNSPAPKMSKSGTGVPGGTPNVTRRFHKNLDRFRNTRSKKCRLRSYPIAKPQTGLHFSQPRWRCDGRWDLIPSQGRVRQSCAPTLPVRQCGRQELSSTTSPL